MTGISQEDGRAFQREQPVQRPHPYAYGLLVQWGKQTHPQGVGTPFDLAWPVAKTKSM